MKVVYFKKILVLSLAFLLAFTSVPGIASAFAETENTESDAAEPVKTNNLDETEEGIEPSQAPETFKVYFKASQRGELKVTIYKDDGEVDRIEELSNGQSIELEYPLGTRALVEATDDKDNGQVFESFTIKVDGKGKPHRVEGNQGDLLEFFFGQNFEINDNTQGIIDYVSTWKSDDDDDDDDDDVIPNELPLITAPDITLDVSENPWNVMTGVVVSDLEDDQDPQKETVVVVREDDQSGQILENLDISQPGVYVLFYTATDSDGGQSTVTRTVTVEEVVVPRSYDGLGYIYITDPNGRIEKLDYAQVNGTYGSPDNDDHVEFYFSNITSNQRKVREIGLFDVIAGIPQFAGINDENLSTNEAYIGRFDETTNSWVQYAQFDETYNKAALAADSNGYFFYAVKNGSNMNIVRRKVYETGGYSGEILTTFSNAQSLNDVADMVVYDGDLYVVYGDELDAELYRIFLDNTNNYQAQLVTGYDKSLWTTGMAVDGSQIIFVGYVDSKDFVSIGSMSNDKSSISMTSAEYFRNSNAGNLLGAASSSPGRFTGKNLGPNAENDNVSTAENQWILIDVLDNDNDPENDPLQIISVTSPANGSVVIENNKVKYTPDLDFVGPDSFVYTIEDSMGNQATATVSVTVVERVASSIVISGAPVINKTYNDPITETYSAVVYDQFNTIIPGAVITFEEDQTYTQINNSGVLSVDASHNINGSPVKVTANSGSLSASLNVTINVSQPIMHAVEFDSNGGTSVQSQSVIDGETANEPLDPIKDGYSFDYWTLNDSEYNFANSVTTSLLLVAKWLPNENTLTYNGNGNTSGQAPQSQVFLSDENVSVASEGDLEKEGYTFIGWNTQADGNGTSYSPSDSITGKDDIELFAQWTANENTLTYNGNGNTSGQAPQSQGFLSDENISVASEGDLEKEGYTFIGWNTQADGNGTSYSPSDSITGTDDIELFAQWTANENTLTYNGNGNTSGQAPQSQGFLSDENISVASEGDLEKEGYIFIGWNTQADGNGTSYSPSDSITGTDDIELFAQWTLDPYVIITDNEGSEIGSEGVTLYIGTAYTAIQGQSQLQAEVVADQQILETTWEIISGSNNITLSSNGLVEGILATSGTPAVVRVNVVLSDESVISDDVNVFVIREDLPVNPPVDPPTQPPVNPPTPTAPTVSISLDRDPVELEYGSEALEDLLSYDLTETIVGSSDPNVEWTIDDPDIATVDQNGVVTAVEQGETTVTVRHIASGATASSTVIVFLVGEEENPLGAVQFFDPYIIGYPDQTFGPQRPVTRAEVATMFARILNLNLDFPGSPKYNDVSEGVWYYRYIQASTRAGLFDGYADGTFKPDAPITRGEIATVFSKYWDFLDIRVNALPTDALADVDGSHWASDYIYKMYNTGIVKGFEDGSYRPNSNTLREQVVGMINTLIARPEFFPENTKYVDITKDHWAFGNIEAATTPYSAQSNLPIIDEEN